MQNFLFHHSLLIGDLIYALPGIRQVCKMYKGIKAPDGEFYSGRAVIYLHLDQKWPMAEAIMRRNGVTLTTADFDNIRPLLMAQDYIEDIKIYNGEDVNIDLDHIMNKYAANINIPYGCISRWFFQVWPEMTCDLGKRWLVAGDDSFIKENRMIIVNRSARSHNPNIDYTFLKKYQNRILFIGLDDEWMSFCKRFFEVEHYKVKDFFHLASALNSASFFIGNQSFCYALAEGLKVPRILELYEPLPHVIPQGELAFDYYHQSCFEFYVERLINR